MTIREATVEDIPALVEMGKRFRAETRYVGIVEENAEQMAETARRLIESPSGVVFVACDASIPIGMIGMMAYPDHISGARVAGEVFWWMEPEARGHGLRLLRAAEKWAKEQCASSIQMVAPDERVEYLYRRLGYSRIETSYGKAVA